MKTYTARRLCVLLLAPIAFASHSSIAQECGEPLVRLGEVMAGLQAGLTAGTRNIYVLSEGFVAAASGESRRGFIVPETTSPSVQCDNDYILIGEWVACELIDNDGVTTRTLKEARDCANSGLDGLITNLFFKVDGNMVDHVQTATKIGFVLEDFIPNTVGDGRAAFYSAGHIIEPFSLLPGPHTATAVFQLDLDCLPRPNGPCDGNPDLDVVRTVNFAVISSGAAP